MPYPFQPRVHAAGDDVPDWAVSDYSTFEEAIDRGAPASLQRVAQRDDRGANAGRGGATGLTWLDNWNRFVVENELASPGEVGAFNLRASKYLGLHPWHAPTVMSFGGNKRGTITRKQDDLARKFLNVDKDNPNNARDLENYNEAFASGRLRLVP